MKMERGDNGQYEFNDDVTELTKCPACNERAEHRTCLPCGTQAWVIDCGHFGQSAEISANDRVPHEYICDKCYESQKRTSGQYIYLHIKDITVSVKLEDDGVIVDAWSDGECIATTAQEWSELKLPAGLIKTVNSGEYLN